MYLLMLLATFLSAIYGYNLSVRPDYDRDVPRKKAMAVIYKFFYQHNTMATLIASQAPSAAWCQPGDLLYGEDDYVAQYKSSGSEPESFPMRRLDRDGHVLPGGRDIMQTGRSFYPSDQMVSKVLCPNGDLYDATAECTSTEDPGGTGGVIDSCCVDHKKYLISYSKLDARWRNRMTGLVSADFLWAVAQKDYKTNMGVITWKGTGTDRGWHFVGRTRIQAAYQEDKEKYIADEVTKNPDLNPDSLEYPASLQLRTNWKLPPIFTENYFTKATGNADMCQESGCLFRIQEI